MAILLRRLLPDVADWNITILATDLNPRFLQKAARGVFGQWSFRDVPAQVREQNFIAHPGHHYELLPEIRRMVTFEPLNLALDSYPSLHNDTNAMDIILCRNVLMYFAPDSANQVVANLRRCLVENGWLILSATETAPVGFKAVHLDGVILYRKTAPQKPAAPPLPEIVAVPTPPPPPVPPPAPLPATAQTVRDLANEGRLEEALAVADKLMAAEKLNPHLHYLRAMILLEQGATHEAAKELHRATYLDHQFALAHFALGNLARSAGHRRDADKHFSNALRALRSCRQDELIPESDGLTTGRLAHIIADIMAEEPVA